MATSKSCSANSFSDSVRRQADRIVESNAVALSGLYDLTADRLLRYAATITRNQHDAEDAVQISLVKVATSPARLANSDQPWLYLLRIVRNESLTILRRKKRWPLIRNLNDLLTRNLVDQIDQQETQMAVWSALRSLPTEQSEVVVLKVWEEMTFAEIGEVLETPTSTVASRYRYAVSKLSEKLQPCVATEDRHA